MRLRRALRLCFQRALHRLLREEPKKKQKKTAAESPGAVPQVTLMMARFTWLAARLTVA